MRWCRLLLLICVAAGVVAQSALAQHPRFVRLQSRPGLSVRCPRRAWGTRLTVRRLEQLGDAYARRFPDRRPLRVHDLSHRHGGPASRHTSHREGRDVDLRLPLRIPSRYVDATPKTLHVERLWFVIRELVRTCDVEFILLDRRLQRVLWQHALARGVSTAQLALIIAYPNPRSGGHPARLQDAIVRHMRGHANHIHVRFRRAGRPLRHHSARVLCGYAVPAKSAPRGGREAQRLGPGGRLEHDPEQAPASPQAAPLALRPAGGAGGQRGLERGEPAPHRRGLSR